jgi:hypothetical protein
MQIAILNSASVGTPWAQIILPNRLEYCIRHNYTMITCCESYNQALDKFGKLHQLLDQYDLVWTLDSDCLITDLTKKIEELSCLGPNVSICLEGLGDHALINAGSIVWKSTKLSHDLIDEIVNSQSEWKLLPYNIQDWLMKNHTRLRDVLTICPQRAFNSVHHDEKMIWQKGDFVYHPCGMPIDTRCGRLENMLSKVIK